MDTREFRKIKGGLHCNMLVHGENKRTFSKLSQHLWSIKLIQVSVSEIIPRFDWSREYRQIKPGLLFIIHFKRYLLIQNSTLMHGLCRILECMCVVGCVCMIFVIKAYSLMKYPNAPRNLGHERKSYRKRTWRKQEQEVKKEVEYCYSSKNSWRTGDSYLLTFKKKKTQTLPAPPISGETLPLPMKEEVRCGPLWMFVCFYWIWIVVFVC